VYTALKDELRELNSTVYTFESSPHNNLNANIRELIAYSNSIGHTLWNLYRTVGIIADSSIISEQVNTFSLGMQIKYLDNLRSVVTECV